MTKKGKRPAASAVFLGLFAVISIVLPACLLMEEAISAQNEKQERLRLQAWIDDKCQSHPHTFQVPQNKSAVDFNLEKFSPGSSCKPGQPVENKGYAIRDKENKPVYIWSQYKEEKPYEKGGPLKKLALPAGEYTLSVAGGVNARVELTCRLK